MRISIWIVGLALGAGVAQAAGPVLPTEVKGKEGVKTYLLTVATSCATAAGDLKRDADAYAALVQAHGADYSAAAAAEPERFAQVVNHLRDDYRRLDSFGYEYIEGIVAGVPSLAAFDVELDAGVPAKGAGPDAAVAPVKIVAGTLVIDREGSLNNYLIEPTVFGTNPRFVGATVELKALSDKPVGVPNAELIVALANYATDGYGRLLAAANAWQPTDKDCFAALVAMTPTLGDYFEEWKEAKISGSATGGRFVAVSRVSDMRGIMASTRLIWQGVMPAVKPKDIALSNQISLGYDQILSFIDDVESRERGGKLTAQQIDALGSQAKEKTEKATAQVAEAAALLKIEVGG
jgi:hypothetical protein